MSNSVFTILFLMTNLWLLGQGDDCDSIGIQEPLILKTQLIPNEVCTSEQSCVEFKTVNFNFVIGFQFSLNYDTTTIDNISYFQTPGNLVGPISTNDDNGTISILWTNVNSVGQSFLDNTNIFTLCFDIIGEPNNDVNFIISQSEWGIPLNPEVVYQISQDIQCSKDTILLNGTDKASYKICCPDLAMTNIKICEEMGMLSFRCCGGILPYQAKLYDNNNIEVNTLIINSDADTVLFQNTFADDYVLELTDADNKLISRSISITENHATELRNYYPDNDNDGFGNSSGSYHVMLPKCGLCI